MDHYHLADTSDHHEYFNLSETEQDKCLRSYKANSISMPFFPDGMKVTYTNRHGLASVPPQPTSSSSSAPPPLRTPVPVREKRPRFMRLSQRGIQARIEMGEPYEDDLHPDNSDNEAEALNMIGSSSVEPEPVAATSLTLQNTPADNQRSPVHQIITQFCRQHRLNAAFQYDASVPSARRETAETLIERLHHRIMACLVREMQPERALTPPPLSSIPAWITLDQVKNPVLIAYVHGDHQTSLPELIDSFGYSVDQGDLNKPFTPPLLAPAHKWEEKAQWAKDYFQQQPDRFQVSGRSWCFVLREKREN